MRFKILLLNVVVLLTFTNCIGYYKKISHYSEDELQWTACYEVGDTVIFKSIDSKFDTLIVNYKNTHTRRNHFYVHFIDDYDGEFYNSKSLYELYVQHSGKSFEGRLSITKTAADDSIVFEGFLYDLFSNSPIFSGDDNQYTVENPIKIVDFIFNNDTIKDCLIFDYTNSSKSNYWGTETDGIKKFVINKNEGLIYYQYLNNDEYYWYRKIRCNEKR